MMGLTRADRKRIKYHARRLCKASTRRRRRLCKASKIAGWAVTIALALVGLFVFWPRMTVDALTTSFDPLDPHPLQFRILNTGLLQLQNVQLVLGLCEIAPLPPKTAKSADDCSGTRIIPKQRALGTISVDEPVSFRVDDVFYHRVGVGSYDISIVVEYKPWRIPIKCERQFRFYTRLENDGRLSWQTKSVPELFTPKFCR